MGEHSLCSLVLVFIFFILSLLVNGEDPYRFFTWNITYGDIYPLGVKQQVLMNTSFVFLYSCLFSFVFFLKNFLEWKWWRMNRNAGDFDKWAISRATDRVCYKWQFDNQCLQQLGWTLPHYLVCIPFSFVSSSSSSHSGGKKKVQSLNDVVFPTFLV